MVWLDHDTHTYYNEKFPNITYTSVTTLLGKYKEKFDEDYHAQRIADREGVTKEEILFRWKEINRMANEYGTELHAVLERFLLSNNRLYIPRNDFEKEIITEFTTVCKNEGIKLINSKGLKPEISLSLEFNELHGIAGQSDIIDDLDDFYFDVWDFKTNKEFKYDSKYRQFMYFPIDHLSYCEYNTYSMQISIYALMYEKLTGKKFNRGGLFHWDKNTKKFKFIPVGYMKKEAEIIVQHYKTTLGLI